MGSNFFNNRQLPAQQRRVKNRRDADLRESVAYELSLSSDQEFFDKYAEAHKKKFGTTWEPDRE